MPNGNRNPVFDFRALWQTYIHFASVKRRYASFVWEVGIQFPDEFYFPPTENFTNVIDWLPQRGQINQTAITSWL